MATGTNPYYHASVRKYERDLAKTVSNPLTDPETEFFSPRGRAYGDFISRYRRRSLDDPMFRKARFIYVHKYMESPNRYRLLGSPRCTRRYAISILTDENKLYYNEYTTTQTQMSPKTARFMSKIFLDGYVLDRDTMMMVSDGVSEHSEPVLAFMRIVAKTLGIQIAKRTVPQMLKRLNKLIPNIVEYKFKTKLRKGYRHITPMFLRRMKEALIERGYLDFLPPHLFKRLSDPSASASERERTFASAVGILYLFRSSIERQYTRNERARKREKLYNFNYSTAKDR